MVKYVDIELGNASTRFDCYLGSTQTCQGLSVDDDLDATFTASAVRT